MASDVTIDGAKIHDNKLQGVRIEGAINTTVQNSHIYNNSQAGDNTYDEIKLRRDVDTTTGNTYQSTGTKILNNTIESNGAINARWGVREEPTNDDTGPTGTVISGNTITGMDSGSVLAPGASNPVQGTSGDDTLVGTGGADELRGLGGNDTYIVNHSGDKVIEIAGEGIDTVAASIGYTLETNVENLFLQGDAASGTGNALNNIIFGNLGTDILKGLDGKGTLDSGAGDDILGGGDGDDTYYVDSAGDLIVEKDHDGLGGADTVYSSVSYSIAAFKEVETLVLLGSGNLNAVGNTSANALIGKSSNNILDGQGGADRMIGGAGNDIYVVDKTGDEVVETAGGGIDTVYSSIDYTLGQDMEYLVLTGNTTADITDDAITGNGNELNNIIIGNATANKLNGGAGDATLDGGAGNDTLDGSLGNADVALYSGNRVDYTITGILADRVISGGSAGTDTLKGIEILQFADGKLVGDTWVSNSVAPPPPPVNTGNDVVARDGTARSNTLTGKDTIDDVMRGLGGNDKIRGRGGNDSLSGGADNDRVYGDSGDDRVKGDGGNDRVYGGSGNDKVYGSAGIDRVYGGSGHDTVDGGSGNDWVYGDSGNDRVYSGTGDDVVNGGTGNDRLYGGAGSDAFVFNSRLGNASTDRKVNFDTIVDFNFKYDSFLLDNAIFKKLGSGTLSNPTQLEKEFFVTGSEARERDDYLIYNKRTGVLSYDADGSGSKEAVEFAQLSKNLKLTYKDFFVI